VAVSSYPDAIQTYDRAMQPVYEALDTAMRVLGDTETVADGVERHLEWWADELAAIAEANAAAPSDGDDPPSAARIAPHREPGA
jgi:uncharacterized protein YukE